MSKHTGFYYLAELQLPNGDWDLAVYNTSEALLYLDKVEDELLPGETLDVHAVVI